MAWWERKLQKGQECSHTNMTPNDWLQLELLRNVYDSELQRKLLQEREPKLEELIKIATLWQNALCPGRHGYGSIQRRATRSN